MAKIKYKLPDGAESVGVEIEDGYVVATYEPKRWRAEQTFIYWYISTDFRPHSSLDYRYDCDNKRFEFGNYFRTEEQAQKVADEIRQIFFKHKHD